MKRSSESQIARQLHVQGVLQKLGVQAILDFGCGHGADVAFYRAQGLHADGYDIEPSFGWAQLPRQDYDLVTLVFVVNVLPTLQHRLDAVKSAAQRVRPGGRLLIAARSEAAIAAEARKGRWQRSGDGFVSSPARGTFQKGIGPLELGWLLGAAGLQPDPLLLRLSRDVSWAIGLRA